MTLASPLAPGTRLSPDPDTARHWAAQELAHPAYASARPSLTSRFLHWLEDHLGFGSNGTGLGTGQLITLLLVLAVIVVVAILLVRRGVRFGVPGVDGGPDVLGGTHLTGAQHRSNAEAAAAQGRYADAVREWMRAIARRLDERGLLDPRPGRTADELAAEASGLLPGLAEQLRAGARIFDDVSYGSVSADAGQAEELRALDAAVEAAQPVALAGFVAPTGTR